MTVTGNPLLFGKTTVLDSRKHLDWTINQSGGFEHCRASRFLPITLSEFPRVTLEQPIVFVADQSLIVPIAVLGLSADRNLFVADDGGWSGRYSPAYARMYPFILAPRQGQDGYSVCIDENYPGFNQQQGMKLFDKDGSQSGFLKEAVAYATEYQRQREESLKFTARIQALGLLEVSKFSFGGEAKESVGGFMTINRDKLAGLKETDVMELFGQKSLELIHLQLASLTNFEQLTLLDKKAASAPAEN